MAQEKYKKYIISKPKLVYDLPHHAGGSESRGFTYPHQVYLDSELLEGSPAVIDMGWRTEVPHPNPISQPHTHPFDTILFYIGADPSNPRDLGAELEVQLENERYRFNTTTVIFVPKGVTHTVRHIRVDRPIFGLGIQLNNKGKYI